ncbi:MAG: polyprenyl synthetase family protein [Planctomycetia bacterium]
MPEHRPPHAPAAAGSPAPAPAAALAPFLAEAKAWVERHLDGLLPQPAADGTRLAEALRYSVEAGGKRLRPALALAASRALGGEDARVLPYAGALELVHTYSLIHDDLPAMDDDDLRRGKPTSHVVFGEALAILAGDALHTLAFESLLAGTTDAALARDLALLLARAAGPGGMVGGQAEDLAAEHQRPDAARLERIHHGKTAALIGAAAEGGARAAGASPATQAAFRAYGLHVGLAFQAADDILDVTGTPESLGKTPGKDRRGEKMTYVALEGLEGARVRARRACDAALCAIAPHDRHGLLSALARHVVAREG